MIPYSDPYTWSLPKRQLELSIIFLEPRHEEPRLDVPVTHVKWGQLWGTLANM